MNKTPKWFGMRSLAYRCPRPTLAECARIRTRSPPLVGLGNAGWIRIGAFAASFFVGLACHGKIDDGFDEERLRESCAVWCETILDCSTWYKEQAEVSTQAECEESCQEYVEVKADQAASCFDLLLDERECAAPLACSEFQNYENYVFAQPYELPVACQDEFDARFGSCNQ